MMLKHIIVAVLLCSCFTVAAKEINIEIFTTPEFKIINQSVADHRGYKVKVYNLDAPKHIENVLSSKLPSSKSDAAKVVRQRIESTPMNVFQDAWKGILKAGSYELKVYPAIVINDGEAILYGLTNVDIAIKQYQQWLKTKTQH